MRSLGLIAFFPLSAVAQCLVVGISDGDTLAARCGAPGAYKQVKVRLAAIDAPEKAQPYGQRSRQSLADLCFQQPARLTERDVDRYGRLVADVECRGKDAGQHQVRAGMAWVYTRYAAQHQHLVPLEALAKAGRIGLWAEVGRKVPPVPPWEWRRAKREGREPVDAAL
ncbi:thermonuclease family protein [Xenophilus sp.]|uniref:thermonuclease family protein n=1 Tax=Xenophilus sp. TaxID=1873499 RepID=UPI0037DC30C8